MIERALTEIVRRHEALRTTFKVVDGKPAQVVAPSATIRLEQRDLRGRTGSATPEDVSRFIFDESRRPFDLGEGPLLRAALARIGAGEHLLVMVMHHIVSDGWSTSVLNRELTQLYMAFVRGQPSPLPELPIQYADFAQWQAEWFAGDVLQSQLGYWRKHLAGLRPLLDLPTDRPRPPIQTSNGSVRGFTLDQRTCEALKSLCQAHGATLFMTLLAAFKLLLHRLSGETDIAIGTPIANRTRSELEGLIGFFVNTLVLRTDLSGDPSFLELLAREREVALGAYGNQDTPFERLVEELRPDRDLSHNPLFQILFAVQNFGIVDRNAVPILGSGAQAGAVGNGTAKFDLTMSVLDTGAGAQGFLEYNSDLFDETTIETIIARYLALLRDVVRRPDETLSRLSIWTPDEPEAPPLGVRRARNAAEPEDSIGVRVAAHAAQSPDALAAVEGDDELVYADLDRRANQVARVLLGAGVTRGDVIGLAMRPGIALPVAVLAILRSGCVWAPIDPAAMIAADGSAAQGRTSRLLDAIEPALVILDGTCRELWPSHPVATRDWTALERDAADQAADPLPDPVAPDGVAEIVAIYEGETGLRAVRLSQSALVDVARDPDLALTPDDRIVCSARPGTIRADYELFGTLAAGATLLFPPPDAGAASRRFAALLRDRSATVLFAGLADLERLTREFPRALRTVRLILCDERHADRDSIAEAFDPETLARLCFVGGDPRAGGFYLLERFDATAAAASPMPLGRPLEGMRITLRDGNGEPVPERVPGELVVATPAAPLGTGDYATGRSARIEAGRLVPHHEPIAPLPVAGVTLDPREIEARLDELPGVAAAAVAARPRHGLRDRGMTALLDLSPGVALADVRAALAAQLPASLIPATWLTDQPIPRAPDGTVDRRALADLVARRDAQSAVDAPFVAPRTDLETALTQIWMEVLGIDQVGVQDNFFRLGGHSLIATQMVARIGDAFRIDFPLQRIFETPTIEQLAQLLEPMIGSDVQPEMPPLVPAPRDRALPLSFAQQRLWFLDQFEPGSAFYNVALPVNFAQMLDVRALEAALADLAERHETLRTHFAVEDGSPVQIIAQPGPVALPVHDLRGLGPAARQDAAARLTRQEAERPFDLQSGPVVRAELVLLGDAECLLLLTVHHIAADGWSLDILFRDLLALYDARRTGRPATLPRLPIQYADFAAWQRRWLSGTVLQRQVDYWVRQLAGAPPLLDLPTDRPRPAVQTFAGRTVATTMPGSLLKAAKHLSEQEQVTLFTTLLAGFYLVLQRYTGREDLVVGSPIANRVRPELEGLIGFFANTLVLRAQVSPTMTFRELIGVVRAVTLGAYAHQDIPFEKLVEELQPERNVAYNPLFQVMFALQNTGRPTAGGTLDETAPPIGAGVAKFDLTIFLSETTRDLRAGIEYNSALFDAETIDRLAGHYETLLAAATAEPDRPIWSLPMLLPTELAALADWNDVPAPVEETSAPALFERQARRTPDAVALLHGETQLTYAELDRRADRWARGLIAHGVLPGERVGVAMARSCAMIVAVLAVLKTGAAYVPIDPAYPSDRIALMASDARATLMIADPAERERLAATVATILSAADLDAFDDADTTAPSPVSIAHPAYVIYTSGSTGRPKGVVMAHGPLASLVRWQIARSALPEGARTAQFASLSFDVSFQEIFATLGAGGTLVMVGDEQRRDPRLLWDLLGRAAVQRLFLPYVALQQLADHAQRVDHLPCALVEVVTAGEQLQVTPQIRALFARIGASLYNQYGPTESHVVTEHALGASPADWPARPSIGRTLPHATVQILDSRDQTCPIGVPGEVCIGGVTLADGYLDRPEVTALRFVPDPQSASGRRLYRTGDRARILASGEIQFLGRLDDQVKIRGFRVEPGEVEAALRTHAQVQEAAVVTREEKGELRLVAYVQADAGAPPSADALRRHVAASLPDFMVPSAYVIMGKLPLTPSGKLSRRDLVAPPAPRIPQGQGRRPLTPVETVLLDIWRDVLMVDAIGLDESFFDLGGHSLLATRVISRVRDELGLELPVRTMFESPTIGGLALSVMELAIDAQEDDHMTTLLAELEDMSDEAALALIEPGR